MTTQTLAQWLQTAVTRGTKTAFTTFTNAQIQTDALGNASSIQATATIPKGTNSAAVTSQELTWGPNGNFVGQQRDYDLVQNVTVASLLGS